MRIRTDFAAVMEVNARACREGLDWYPMTPTFDPDFSGLTPENSFWVCEEVDGDVIGVDCARRFEWPSSTLREEALSLFYGSGNAGRTVEVTAAAADLITGNVLYVGGAWVHPAHRGRSVHAQMSMEVRRHATDLWPDLDWVICLVKQSLAEKIGYPNTSRSIAFPGSPHTTSTTSELVLTLVYSTLDGMILHTRHRQE